ncbi:unnamed protein product [Ectocarpus sp. CCAP 1310/34]|nr:unnamed protein product [Ectocarpus sp. CCAP 1310/34]
MKFVWRGILFKLADGSKGPYLGNDEAAAKGAGHDLRGATHYLATRIRGLRYALQCLIDYKGFRMTAQAVLPVNKESLRYGSDDGGKTVHNDDESLAKKLKAAAKKLNLCTHRVNDKDMYSACDIEGHVGEDGSHYLLDFARTFPPESPKKKGDKTDAGNYRGITLLNTVGKVLCKMLNDRIVRVDMKRAYDTVWRNGLWKQLFNAVMLDGELSQLFDIEQGVPQGCTLSPTLFQVFINDLLEVVEAVRKGVKVGDTETSVSGMLFADDFVGMSDTPEGLQLQIDAAKKFTDKWRLSANVQQIAVMVCIENKEEPVEHRWKWGIEEIAVVDQEWVKVAEDVWKGLDMDEDETLETEGLQGFKEKISVACAEREEQNLRKESKDKEGLEVYGMLKEGIGFKDYLHGPMDAGTKLKNLRKETKDEEGLEVYGMLKEGTGFKDYLHGPMDAGTKLKGARVEAAPAPAAAAAETKQELDAAPIAAPTLPIGVPSTISEGLDETSGASSVEKWGSPTGPALPMRAAFNPVEPGDQAPPRFNPQPGRYEQGFLDDSQRSGDVRGDVDQHAAPTGGGAAADSAGSPSGSPARTAAAAASPSVTVRPTVPQTPPARGTPGLTTPGGNGRRRGRGVAAHPARGIPGREGDRDQGTGGYDANVEASESGGQYEAFIDFDEISQ